MPLLTTQSALNLNVSHHHSINPNKTDKPDHSEKVQTSRQNKPQPSASSGNGQSPENLTYRGRHAAGNQLENFKVQPKTTPW